MKYRDARLLKKGDQITRKYDQLVLIVESIELYGQFKRVKILCTDKTSLFNEEIE